MGTLTMVAVLTVVPMDLSTIVSFPNEYTNIKFRSLIADSNSVQAKCVLKKNPCSDGYFEDLNEACTVCHDACATCHGAGLRISKLIV